VEGVRLRSLRRSLQPAASIGAGGNDAGRERGGERLHGSDAQLDAPDRLQLLDLRIVARVREDQPRAVGQPADRPREDAAGVGGVRVSLRDEPQDRAVRQPAAVAGAVDLGPLAAHGDHRSEVAAQRLRDALSLDGQKGGLRESGLQVVRSGPARALVRSIARLRLVLWLG
jgi:hypothetical protein